MKKDIFRKVDNFKLTESVLSTTIYESGILNPLITVAIPTFKQQNQILKETIDNVLNQVDFKDFDIIVVDNYKCSDSETAKLMQQYEGTKVSYYQNNENIGMCGNWNRLYCLSKGKWVVMLHDDDLLNKNYLKIITEVIENHQNNFIHGIAVGQMDFYDSSEILNSIKSSMQDIQLLNITPKDLVWGNGLLRAPVGLCIKKTSMIELGGFSDNYYPSLDYHFYALFSQHYKLCKVSEVLGFHRNVNNTSSLEKTLAGHLVKDIAIRKQLASTYYPIIWPLILSILKYRQLRRVGSYKFIYDKNNDIDPKSFVEQNGIHITLFDELFGRFYEYIKLLWKRKNDI